MGHSANATATIENLTNGGSYPGTVNVSTGMVNFPNVQVGEFDQSNTYKITVNNGDATDSVNLELYNTTKPRWTAAIPNYTVDMGDVITIDLALYASSTVSGNLVASIASPLPGTVAQTGNLLQISTTSVSAGSLATVSLKRELGNGSYSEVVESNQFTITVNDTTTTGIGAHTSVKNIILYPNPATEQLVIAVKDQPSFEGSYEIIDLQGKTAAKGALLTHSTSIQVAALAPGMYVIKIVSKKGQKMSFLFVKA